MPILHFFRRAKTKEARVGDFLAPVGVDIHSHLLPGIDDGVKTWEESLTLIRAMQSLGYRKLIVTPHISADFFPNSPELILEKLAQLRIHIQEADDIFLTVEAAAEYMIDESFLSVIANGGRVLPIDNTYLLIEMGFMQEDPRFRQAIFAIQAAGYQPILAHPERYTYYQRSDLTFWSDLKSRGCLLQLNTIALCGYYGKKVKQTAEFLLQNGLYDFCGSDIHHMRHCDTLRQLGILPIAKTLVKSNMRNINL